MKYKYKCSLSKKRMRMRTKSDGITLDKQRTKELKKQSALLQIINMESL